MADNLATIDGQLQLLISSAVHAVSWIQGRDEVQCMVEVEQRGLVRIRPVDAWAKLHSLPVEEAVQSLAGDMDTPWEEIDHPMAFFATAKRKVQAKRTKPERGPSVHELKLPPLAVLALFAQGTGPIRPQRGGRRSSGTVVLRTFEDAIELVGQTVFGESEL